MAAYPTRPKTLFLLLLLLLMCMCTSSSSAAAASHAAVKEEESPPKIGRYVMNKINYAGGGLQSQSQSPLRRNQSDVLEKVEINLDDIFHVGWQNTLIFFCGCSKNGSQSQIQEQGKGLE
ncbi:unnamed protein product [Ilex paraguariensis]|uniref:Uncharacterized protein n=1 Tax=Ilex paraguariensis TaxID=185542 RepID=A0ABC8UUA2_9AQUA